MPKYGPCLKLIENKRWSNGVEWDFCTLRNDLNLRLFLSLGFTTSKKAALARAQRFIEVNGGLGKLFKPSYFQKAVKERVVS